MLLLELTRKALHRVTAGGFADWLRISVIGLVSVVLVFLIAQWTALLGVVLTLNRAHVTEADGDDRSSAGSMIKKMHPELSRAPPMNGAAGTTFRGAPVFDDGAEWQHQRSPQNEPPTQPVNQEQQPAPDALESILLPRPGTRSQSAASGLSLSDFNTIAESSRLTWRANPYAPGLLATNCTCITASWWRWSVSGTNRPATNGHDPPEFVIDKPPGVP